MQKLYILFTLLYLGQSYGMAEEKDKSIIMVFRNDVSSNVSSNTISTIHQQIPTMSESAKKELEKLLICLISECSHHKSKVITTYENILKLLVQPK